jgi:hypothetical protein
VPAGPGDQQQAHIVAVHHAEVVLLIIDMETENVAVISNASGHVVERQLRHDLLQHVWWSGRVRLLIGLPEPQRVPVRIADLEHPHLDPVDLLQLGWMTAPGGDRGVHHRDVVGLEEQDGRSSRPCLKRVVSGPVVGAELNPGRSAHGFN